MSGATTTARMSNDDSNCIGGNTPRNRRNSTGATPPRRSPAAASVSSVIDALLASLQQSNTTTTMDAAMIDNDEAGSTGAELMDTDDDDTVSSHNEVHSASVLRNPKQQPSFGTLVNECFHRKSFRRAMNMHDMMQLGVMVYSTDRFDCIDDYLSYLINAASVSVKSTAKPAPTIHTHLPRMILDFITRGKYVSISEQIQSQTCGKSRSGVCAYQFR